MTQEDFKRKRHIESLFLIDLKKGGLPIGTTKNGMRKVADTGGKGDWVSIKELEEKNKQQSKAEIQVTDEEIAAYDESIEQPSVNQRWNAYELFCNMVADGTTKSLVAFGTGGVGKTFVSQSVFEKLGLRAFDEDKHDINSVDDYDYVKITGSANASSVYKALFEFNGKTLMFDDCDSALKDAVAVDFFKGALDSSGDGGISYSPTQPIKTDRITTGTKFTPTGISILPNRFKFTGNVIFISNMSPKEIPQPLIDSRCLSVDLSMTAQETIDRIKNILPKMDIKDSKGNSLNATKEEKELAINFLDKYKNKIRAGKLNARTLGNIIKVIHASKNVSSNWEDAALTLLSN